MAWYDQLLKQKEEFYLKIWLYDQRFIQSEIVAAKKERIDRYLNLFTEQEIEKPFPIQRFSDNADLLQKFEWQLYQDEEPFFEKSDGDIYSEAEIAEIKKQSYRSEYYKSSKENVYFFNYGDMWIGTLKNN